MAAPDSDRWASGELKNNTIARLNEIKALAPSLAALERRAGRTAEAAALDTRRSQIWQRWANALPDNPFVARQLTSSH
jgi:hypothetical protein